MNYEQTRLRYNLYYCSASSQALEPSAESKYANLLQRELYKTLRCCFQGPFNNISGHASPHQESMHTCGVIYLIL